MRRSIACREALERIEAWANEATLEFRHERDRGFGAVFSRCGAYRYLLWRMHHPRGRLLGMGMLNPSTADEHRDDPTIARCHRLARERGYPGLLIWNLFALRATDPATLRKVDDPIGPDNDAAIDLAVSLCSRSVLAWGNHGRLGGRSVEVRSRCEAAGTTLAAFGLTRQGEPRHPLYLTANVRPRALRLVK